MLNILASEAMILATQILSQYWADCVLFHVNAIEKGMNPFLLTQLWVYSKVDRDLTKVNQPKEMKIEFRLAILHLKIDSVASCLSWRSWVNTYQQVSSCYWLASNLA